MVHLFPHWDFNPGQLVDVRAASNCCAVELLVNGKSQGVQKLDHQHGRSLLGNWQVPYEPGTITAIAYDEEGREVVRQERRSFGDSAQLCLAADKQEILADHEDLCFVTIEALDKQGHPVEKAVDYVTVKVQGPARLLGMDNGDSTDYDQYKTDTRKLFSGKLLAVLGATDEPGEIRVEVSGEGLLPAQLLIEAIPVSHQSTTVLEDCAGAWAQAPDWVPTRKVELCPQGETIFDADHRELELQAVVSPGKAAPTLIWKVVNDGGIEVPTAQITPISKDRVRITACGDGQFRIRCMAKEPDGRITVISQLEMEAKGLGTAFLDPYGFVSAGLYTGTIGDITNGNEKGVATSRDGVSGVVFEGVDFGEYGSDEITLPVFAFSGDPHFIQVWEGTPLAEGSRLIDTLTYEKPSIWNVYQEETWKLPERLKGVTGLGFLLKDQKVHIKGFSFRKLEKAFGELYAGEATRVYGDEFTSRGNRVEGIGNNVTLEYENMDFGEKGSCEITIKGWTPLPVNTIHIRFHTESGETQARMAEFRGSGREEYEEQVFTFDRISGRGRLDFIFLPGCQFNMESFRFRKEEE